MCYQQQLVDNNLISKMKFSKIIFSIASAKEFSQFYRNTITEPEPLGSRNEIFFNNALREPRSVLMSKIKNRMYRRELQGNAHYNKISKPEVLSNSGHDWLITFNLKSCQTFNFHFQQW